jgi:hypothetical protein
MKKLFILIAVLVAAGCSSNKSGSPAGPRAGTIAGTLANSGGPLQNAEVKLSTYKDENCVKLSQKSNLSPDEDQQSKQCRQQLSVTNSDAQGKYNFPNVSDGWYSITVNWTTKEDPLPTNPMWKPLFLYRADDFLITFIAAKDGSFHLLAVGPPFQFQGGGSTEKNLTLKL